MYGYASSSVRVRAELQLVALTLVVRLLESRPAFGACLKAPRRRRLERLSA